MDDFCPFFLASVCARTRSG